MRLKIASLLLGLSLASVCGPVSAQHSLSNAYGSQFDRTDTEPETALNLVNQYGTPPPIPGVSVTYFDALTVHTNKDTEGVVEDFHANGRSVRALVALDRPRRAELFLSDSKVDSAGKEWQGGTHIIYAGSDDEPAVRYVLHGRHGELLAMGVRSEKFTADGATDIYKNVFLFFSQTPPFRLRQNTTAASIDFVSPAFHAFQAEASWDRQNVSSSLLLHDISNGSRLDLPLGVNGGTVSGALRYTASVRLGTLIYYENTSLSAASGVEREGDRIIGQGKTTSEAQAAGFGLQYNPAPSRTFGLYYETRHDRWNTNGLVPNGSDLGLSVPFALNVRYHAGYEIHQKSIGIFWDHHTGAAHEFRIGDRWIEIDPKAEADYNLSLFLFPQSGGNATALGLQHAHFLRCRYEFPVSKLESAFELTQIIPLSGRQGSGGASSGGGSSSSPQKRTIGGYTLAWTLGYRF